MRSGSGAFRQQRFAPPGRKSGTCRVRQPRIARGAGDWNVAAASRSRTSNGCARAMTEQDKEPIATGRPGSGAADEQIPDRSQYIRGGRVGVLLVHGLGGTPIELRFIAQGLARAGHTVHCCQLAGHCGTPEELRRSTWREWYASVEAAHDRLQEDCDIIIAGGLSMGGILATHLAQQPARRRARSAALRPHAQARRLVDALVLAGAALRPSDARSGSSSTSPSASPTA